MTKLVHLLLALALVGVGGYLYWQQSGFQTPAAPPVSIGNLNIYRGQVEIIRENVAQPGATGNPLYFNDVVRAGEDGRASIILKDGSLIRLDAGTEVRVAEIEYQGEKLKTAVFKLVLGRTWSRVEPLVPGASYQVETPTLVGAVRGTSFFVSYLENVSQIYVGLGEILSYLVSNQENVKTVKSGQLLAVSDAAAQADFEKGPVAVPPEFRDDWVIFNEKEDSYFEEPPPPPSESKPALKTESKFLPAKPASPTLSALRLEANPTVVRQNEIVVLRVIGEYSDGSKRDETKNVTWKQEPYFGVVDNSGYLHPSFAAEGRIYAAFQKVVSNSVALRVNPEEILPVKRLIGLELAYKKNSPAFQDTASGFQTSRSLPSAQFTASALYSDNSQVDVTSQVQWSVFGTAGGRIAQDGFYQPVTEGADRVNAVFEGQSAASVINIP